MLYITFGYSTISANLNFTTLPIYTLNCTACPASSKAFYSPHLLAILSLISTLLSDNARLFAPSTMHKKADGLFPVYICILWRYVDDMTSVAAITYTISEILSRSQVRRASSFDLRSHTIDHCLNILADIVSGFRIKKKYSINSEIIKI